MHLVGYLYIMDLNTNCISDNETCTSVLPM